MDTLLARRSVLTALGLGSVAVIAACGSATPSPVASASAPAPASASSSSPAAAPLALTVFKSPTCGCCTVWMDYANSNGFTTRAEHPQSMDAKFAELGVAAEHQGCHVAVDATGTLFVGHVSAKFMREYLAAPPSGAKGISVPGMPVGTPGMEAGDQLEPYNVLLLKADGAVSTFASVKTLADQAV